MAKGSLPAYLGGGMPSLGYFPDFMPGQQAALAEQLSAGYRQPTSNATLDGPKADGYTGSYQDYLINLSRMYSPMGSAIPKPVARPGTPAPVVAKPVVIPKKRTAKPTVPWRPTTYDPNRR